MNSINSVMLFGKVKFVDPCEIRLRNDQVLTEEQLVFTETAMGNGYGLDIGDEVILSATEDENKFVVIDKLTDSE